MNKNSQEPTTHVSARRRLVRGAFAAPVALTLYNGSAFAATSVSCIAKEILNPTYPAPLQSEFYLRVQLYTLPGSRMSTWIKGSDVTGLAALNTPVPYILGTQWQCYSVGFPANVKINALTVTPVAGDLYGGQPTVGINAPQPNGSYVALRVNATGMIVGVVGLGVSNPGTSAVHDSCWASFNPTRP